MSNTCLLFIPVCFLFLLFYFPFHSFKMALKLFSSVWASRYSDPLLLVPIDSCPKERCKTACCEGTGEPAPDILAPRWEHPGGSLAVCVCDDLKHYSFNMLHLVSLTLNAGEGMSWIFFLFFLKKKQTNKKRVPNPCQGDQGRKSGTFLDGCSST